jgi:hypothetical protein
VKFLRSVLPHIPCFVSASEEIYHGPFSWAHAWRPGGRAGEGPDQTLSEMRRTRKRERHRIGIAPQHLHVCGTLHMSVVTIVLNLPL